MTSPVRTSAAAPSEVALADPRRALPPGWTWITVEAAGEVTLGRQRSPKHHDGPGMRPYLRVANVYEDRIDTTDVKSMNFSLAELARFELEQGDVLLNEGQSLELVGRPAIFRGEVPGACFQNTLVRFRCRPFVRPEYALAIFRCYLHTGVFRRMARRTTNLAHLGTQRFAKMSFPLPPLPEQQRIIDVVESYSRRLDDAVATLSRVERNLARYRASVLSAAVEGRLLPTEAARAHQDGRDYEPASVLLARILAERRRRWGESREPATYREPSPPDATNLPALPEGWCWASLDQLLVRIEAGKSFRCAERPPRAGEVGVVKVSAVSWGQFQDGESKTCPRAELVRDELLIRPGDFLISRANTIELVGACVIVTAVTRDVMLSDKVLRLRTAGGLDRWLLWVLRSRFGRRQIEALATGNQDSMRNISQKAIASICIPLPPEVECRAIVAEIEARMSVVTESERSMQRSLGRCARLRQSILTWAFEGKLAEQDPRDEPASVVLARLGAAGSAGSERPAASTTRLAHPERGAHRKKLRA